MTAALLALNIDMPAINPIEDVGKLQGEIVGGVVSFVRVVVKHSATKKWCGCVLVLRGMAQGVVRSGEEW